MTLDRSAKTPLPEIDHQADKNQQKNNAKNQLPTTALFAGAATLSAAGAG